MRDFDSRFKQENDEFDEMFRKQLRFKNIITCVIVGALIIFGIIALLK